MPGATTWLQVIANVTQSSPTRTHPGMRRAPVVLGVAPTDPLQSKAGPAGLPLLRFEGNVRSLPLLDEAAREPAAGQGTRRRTRLDESHRRTGGVVGGHHDRAQVAQVELVDVGQRRLGPVPPVGDAQPGE